jgi:putative transposase
MKSEKVCLLDEERKFLKDFLKKGERKARMIARATVLLLADKGIGNDEISRLTGMHRRSIWRIRKRYLSEGLQSALEEKPRPGQPRKYSNKHEAEVIALACSNPPEGRARWSIVLLTTSLKDRKGFETINKESVRLILKKQSQAMEKENVVHTRDRRRISVKDV